MSLTIGSLSAQSMSSAVSGASSQWSPQQKMSSLYDQIDVNGAGSIGKSDLANAFQTMNPPPVFQSAGLDSIWGQLDPSGTGKVSQDEFVKTMKDLMVSLRRQSPDPAAESSTASTATKGLNILI